MLGIMKAITAGGVITLQILSGANSMPATTEQAPPPATEVQQAITDDMIDSMIDECDIEDADRFLNYGISSYLKGMLK